MTRCLWCLLVVPLLELHRQGPEALQLHVQGLAELCSALETAEGVSPEERRALGDRILVDGHTHSVWEDPAIRTASRRSLSAIGWTPWIS